MFPADLRMAERMDDPACVPSLTTKEWGFIAMYGVHDLLTRQIPKLPAFERACLLVQALTYAETMLGVGDLSLRDWEMGVFFDAQGAPVLKLLRPDTMQLGIFDDPREHSLRSIVTRHWGFDARNAQDEASTHVARVLAWARVQLTPPDDILRTVIREILDAFALHPRAGAMRRLVVESQLSLLSLM
jgi:hypothetical protein